MNNLEQKARDYVKSDPPRKLYKYIAVEILNHSYFYFNQKESVKKLHEYKLFPIAELTETKPNTVAEFFDDINKLCGEFPVELESDSADESKSVLSELMKACEAYDNGPDHNSIKVFALAMKLYREMK